MYHRSRCNFRRLFVYLRIRGAKAPHYPRAIGQIQSALMKKEIIAGAGLAAAATWAGFQCYLPKSQVWGRTFIGFDRFAPLIALTYDDGPNDPWTLRLLEVLEQQAVKATFFLIGRFVRQKPEIARALVAGGHEVGIHTWDHPNLIFASPAEVRSQIERTRQVIFDAAGVEPTLFRPPFGARTPITLSVVRRLGFTPVMWNVTCRDWKPTASPQRIMELVARQARGGDVILLHDGGHRKMGANRSASVEATKQIIRKYKDRDYRFLSISEMMRQA
jgi:peptidoglycan/xylan/chitin deacetylase (PgdA/CDA1 family)